MPGGAVGKGKNCSEWIRHAGRHKNCHCSGGNNFLGKSTHPAEADDLVALFYVAHTRAYADYITSDFRAGGKWQRRLYLILLLNDEDIGEIDARGAHANFYFTGCGLARINILQH